MIENMLSPRRPKEDRLTAHEEVRERVCKNLNNTISRGLLRMLCAD